MKIRCTTKDTLKLGAMSEFQGDLKKRSKKSLKALEASLKDEGLISPFFIWKESAGDVYVYHLLDGHSRRAALMEMADTDPSILELDLPVVYIEAETLEEAKKALLQIVSNYGRVSKEGLVAFCDGMVYSAPVTKILERRPNVRKALETRDPDKVLVKVLVDKANLEATLEVFKKAGIEVLK